MARPIRSKLVKNAIFLNQYNSLLNTKDVFAPDFAKVKEILHYAYNHVGFYRKLYDENGIDINQILSFDDFEQIPIIDKQTLLDNKILTSGDIKYYEGHTGGSTGATADLYLSLESIYREKAFIYHYWQNFGYDFTKSKIVTLRGGVKVGKNTPVKFNPLYNEYILSAHHLSKESVVRYSKVIDSYKPEFLHGYPSAIISFAKYAKLIGYFYQFKAIFLISEGVSKLRRVR